MTAPEWPDRIVLMRNPANPDDWRIAADPNMIPCPDDGVYRRADLVPAPVSREAVAERIAPIVQALWTQGHAEAHGTRNAEALLDAIMALITGETK